MDKEYALYTIRERLGELKRRYNILCNGRDETGRELSYGTAANYRCDIKRDMNLLYLIEELIVASPGKLCNLSDAAAKGLEMIMEPCERHRRLKG